ncbi:hypothetical protein IAT38_005646 [Cryptococcus sp. DSM 104549]
MSLLRLARAAPSSSRQLAARKTASAATVCSQCRHFQTALRPTLSTRPARVAARRMYASAAAAVADQKNVPVVMVPKAVPVEGASAITPVLRGIQELLENEIGGDDVWAKRVQRAAEDLGGKRRGRIAVIGDSLAAPRDLVSALLQDPLADHEATRQALLNRHKDANIEVFQISQGEQLLREPEALSLSSSWLQATGYDVVEISARRDEPESIVSTLFATDALVVVLDPIRLTSTPEISPLFPSLLARSSVHFVINGPLPPNSSEASVRSTLLEQLRRVKLSSEEISPNIDASSLNVTFVQASKALSALDALAAGLENQDVLSPSKTKAFDTFQHDFLQSHIGPLQASLLAALTSSPHLGPVPQLATAREVAELALRHIGDVITRDRDTAREASYTVSELRRKAEKSAIKAKHLSVASRGIDGGLVEGGVQYEMDRIKGEIERSFDGRLSWLGLVGRLRVDDVALELGGYVGERFGVELERQLVFETGQLSHLQLSLSKSADRTIRQLSHPPSPTHATSSPATTSPHPFTSPLLTNHLSTLSLSIPPLTPTSLLSPLSSRRTQLLTTSIPRLQTSASRALLTTYSTALLGCSLSWVAYVPPVEILSAGTAGGLGLLGVVASLAWGQRLWGKAQKKFWKDWDRVTGMLKGDLETRFDTALQTQILAKPLAAADGLEKLIERREKRLDTLQTRVDQLQSRL